MSKVVVIGISMLWFIGNMCWRGKIIKIWLKKILRIIIFFMIIFFFMYYLVYVFFKDGEKILEYMNIDYEFLGLRENMLLFYDIEDIIKVYNCIWKCVGKEC